MGNVHVLLLALILTCVGCESEQGPPPEEVTMDEMNLALDYLASQGKEPPDTVQQLMELPQFSNKVLPQMPSGVYLAIDREKNCVTVYLNDVPGTE